ncbi:DUF6580 family putative transport protein [Croceimicrobium sp.]|uniref:DUF6580 family putative transport protein n=1 Tax=Croceimicrobium sp. TaxID=2828340 RepID=UPI003BAD3D5A
MKKQLIYLAILFVLAIGSRLIAPWPNFTAMTAVVFTGGMLFGKRYQALLFPMLILFVSDFIINNTLYSYMGFTLITQGAGWLYSSYLLIALLGVLNFGSSKWAHVIVGGISGTLLFFLLTNFGVWLGNPAYPQNINGLIGSYVAGLPFLLNQVLGTVFYGVVIVAAYRLTEGKPILERIRA